MIYNIYDEFCRLSGEIVDLIEQATDICLGLELGSVYNKDLPIEISLTITNKEDIKEINMEYRGIDSTTDVLSFPQYDDKESIVEGIGSLDEGMSMLLGDVVLCYGVALEQAKEFGNTESREVVYLYTHSLLHLLGYDHMTDEDRDEMRAHEENVMERLGLSRQ